MNTLFDAPAQGAEGGLPPKDQSLSPTIIYWNPVVVQAFRGLLAPDETRFTFATLDDDKSEKDEATEKFRQRCMTRTLHGTFEERWPNLYHVSSMGAGVYVTANRTDLKGRKKHNIIGARAMFVDLDGADPMNIERLSLRCSFGVQTSPGKYHFYWRVKGVSLEEFGPLQLRLASLMDGDLSVADLPQIMRLPGFSHQKGEPFLSKLVVAPECYVYEKDEFVTALEESERQCGINLSKSSGPSKPAKPKTVHTPAQRDAEEQEHIRRAQRVYTPEEEANLRSALAVIPADEYDTWFKTGAALYATGWGERARISWDEWSRKSDKFKLEGKGGQDETWRGYGDHTGARLSIASIINGAQKLGWQGLPKTVSQAVDPMPATTPPSNEDAGTSAAPQAPPSSSPDDDAVFRRLAALPPVDYERVRGEEAEKLGVRVGVLDKVVAKYRPPEEEEGGAGRPCRFLSPSRGPIRWTAPNCSTRSPRRSRAMW